MARVSLRVNGLLQPLRGGFSMKYAVGYAAGVLSCLGALIALAFQPASRWWR